MKLKQFNIRDVISGSCLMVTLPFMSLGAMAGTHPEASPNAKHVSSYVRPATGNPSLSRQQLTGRHSDAAGRPVSGVEVRNLNTNAVTVTDSEGRFSLNGSASDRLQFRSLGFETSIVNGSS